MTRFRGSSEHPGLMMALDRGGSCEGMAYRLPAEGVDAALTALIKREMPFVNSGMSARWMPLKTGQGPFSCGGVYGQPRRVRLCAGPDRRSGCHLYFDGGRECGLDGRVSTEHHHAFTGEWYLRWRTVASARPRRHQSGEGLPARPASRVTPGRPVDRLWRKAPHPDGRVAWGRRRRQVMAADTREGTV